MQVEELKAVCDQIPTEVVFSHNDLLSGNILIVFEPGSQASDMDKGNMQFIDYEYSDCGYRYTRIGDDRCSALIW